MRKSIKKVSTLGKKKKKGFLALGMTRLLSNQDFLDLVYVLKLPATNAHLTETQPQQSHRKQTKVQLVDMVSNHHRADHSRTNISWTAKRRKWQGSTAYNENSLIIAVFCYNFTSYFFLNFRYKHKICPVF